MNNRTREEHGTCHTSRWGRWGTQTLNRRVTKTFLVRDILLTNHTYEYDSGEPLGGKEIDTVASSTGPDKALTKSTIALYSVVELRESSLQAGDLLISSAIRLLMHHYISSQLSKRFSNAQYLVDSDNILSSFR